MKKRFNKLFYNPVGKTLADVHQECGYSYPSFSFFVLENEDDCFGTFFDESLSIDLFLQKHPEYKNSVVMCSSFFFDSLVLRILPVKN